MDRLSVGEFKEAEKSPVVVVLDFVRSHRNVGAIFRNADAFLIEKIYLCRHTPTPPHWEIRKTAIGATKSVDWEYEAETEKVLKKLKSEGYTLIAIEQTDQSKLLSDYQPQPDKKYALVFGHEIEGVSDAALAECDEVLEIPQKGTKHSLNVSVTAGVVLYQFTVGS